MDKEPFSLVEWLFLFVITGCVVTVSLFSWLHHPFFVPPVSRFHSILVSVEGAVKHSGPFFLPPGSKVKKVLQKAKPLKGADKEALDLNFPLYESCRLVVPYRKTITVYVTGAVKERGSIELPYGATFAHLLKKIQLEEGADVSFFRKKRILQHEEEVQIPFSL